MSTLTEAPTTMNFSVNENHSADDAHFIDPFASTFTGLRAQAEL